MAQGDWTPPERWMVVRRSKTILGGWRIVQHDLTEQQARKRAAEYKRPHEAMSHAQVSALRIAAIGEGK